MTKSKSSQTRGTGRRAKRKSAVSLRPEHQRELFALALIAIAGVTIIFYLTGITGQLGGGWKLFAKAINIFDKDYETTGRLAASHFNNAGGWEDTGAGSRFVSPGAPRAGWIGVRYEFGGAPEAK